MFTFVSRELSQSDLNLPQGAVSDPTADILFESSDGIRFRLHSSSLAITSGALAVPPKTRVDDDPTKLDEASQPLEILFQFIEPPSDAQHDRYPSVVNLDSTLFFCLAEAAEKYVVYPAMSACYTRMQ